jgi:uncharacterized protein
MTASRTWPPKCFRSFQCAGSCESWKYAQQVAVPTLLVAAEHGEVIPRTSTETLYKRFRNGVASMRVVAGTGHNTISDSSEYLPLLKGTP